MALKNYLNKAFPVTSFVYALYCDAEYAKYVLDRYIKDPTDWTPLDPYHLPKGLAELFYEEVPRAMPPNTKPGTYNPPAEKIKELFVRFMQPELTNEKGEKPVAPHDRATYHADRPVTSCLGEIFVNVPSSFDPSTKVPPLSAKVAEALKRVKHAPNGRPYLSKDDANALLEPLMHELSTGKAVW